jgi:hypothetical protein
MRPGTPPHGSVVEQGVLQQHSTNKPFPARPDSSWLGDDDSDEEDFFPFVSRAAKLASLKQSAAKDTAPVVQEQPPQDHILTTAAPDEIVAAVSVSSSMQLRDADPASTTSRAPSLDRREELQAQLVCVSASSFPRFSSWLDQVKVGDVVDLLALARSSDAPQ